MLPRPHRHLAIAATAFLAAAPLIADPPALPSAFDVAPGFRVELVAQEPLVEAPAAMQFDEDGRLWVVEWPTYMNDVAGSGERAPRNRVVVLEDEDGDGRMDRRTVFLSGLVLPRGAAPCRGGALVIEPPWLYHCVDVDGDGRCDTKRPLIDGFAGLDSPEHAGNGPIYGLDNAWECSQHDERFRFDGERLEREAVSAHGQWGITKDDVGRLYYTPNSQPVLVDVLPKSLPKRNRRVSPWGIGLPLVEDTAVHPSHPTRGVNRGYQDGILRPDGTLANYTCACSPSIVRTSRLGDDMRGAVVVCESAGNLVARYRLDDDHGVPKAVRIDPDSELLRSNDERFRPVATTIGPDGALYIADLSRGVIQHKVFLTDYLKGWIAEHGLETPLANGRIYRLVPNTWQQPERPRLSKASDAELARTIAHSDGWWRDTAQRILVERRAVGAEPLLRELLESADPLVRLQAWWTLDGLGLLRTADLLRAGADPDRWMRVAACQRIAGASGERTITEPGVASLVASLRKDPERIVRAYAYLATTNLPAKARTAALVPALLGDASDRLTRGAILAAFGDATLDGLRAFAAQAAMKGKPDDARLRALVAACLRGSPAERSQLFGLAAERASADDLLLAASLEHELATDANKGKTITLAEEPTALAIVAGRDSPGAPSLKAILARASWPGDPAHQQAAAPLDAGGQALVERGRRIFTLCAGCHHIDATGTPGQAPPLVDSPIATGNPRRFARVLLQGLAGGQAADGAPWPTMPQPSGLTDADLAAVMTYVRRSFGHAASPVSPEEVASVRSATSTRARPWTREELDAID